MEAERQTLAEAVTAAERRAAEEKLRVDDLQPQLKSAKAAAETVRQELQDYKHKASRILQVRLAVFCIYLNCSRQSLFFFTYRFRAFSCFLCPFAIVFFVIRLL